MRDMFEVVTSQKNHWQASCHKWHLDNFKRKYIIWEVWCVQCGSRVMKLKYDKRMMRVVIFFFIDDVPQNSQSGPSIPKAVWLGKLSSVMVFSWMSGMVSNRWQFYSNLETRSLCHIIFFLTEVFGNYGPYKFLIHINSLAVSWQSVVNKWIISPCMLPFSVIRCMGHHPHPVSPHQNS